MTAAQQRKAQRRVHLAGALLLIAYLYAPLEAQLQDAVRFVGLPALVLTGIAMWQAPRIRRLRKRFGTHTRARFVPYGASRRARRRKVTST
jgi:thiosulfate reductase cytochrome b subunit